MAQARVLVVDDEEGPREAIRMILKPHYQVYTAGSGEEVLAALHDVRPDVIFMDVKMPRMDGVQLLERVKALDQAVEVVMITAYASLDTVQRAMRLGAMDYLVKPFAPRELQEVAERAVSRRRGRAEPPGGALAGLIAQMRELARRSDPAVGAANLATLLRSMLGEAQRVAGALGVSFFGTEPPLLTHADVPREAAALVAESWRPALDAIRQPLAVGPGSGPGPLSWPEGLRQAWPACRAALVVPLTEETVPRVAGRLVLYLERLPVDLRAAHHPLRPVLDLMVTALQTSALLVTAARQANEQSLRAVQREILRQISTAVLEDPSLDRTVEAITRQLQHAAGYRHVEVLLEPGGDPGPERADRAVFPLVAQGRPLGFLVVEANPQARELDPSERELLRLFSESVALILRNAHLHRELSETNTFLKNLIESAGDAIVALDPGRRVVTWNPSAERMFGRPLAEVLGKPVGEALPAAVVAQLDPGVATSRMTRTLVVRTGEGEAGGLDLTVTCSPIPWGGRGEPGLLLLAKDVTEQRRWERQMARSEKLAALGQLAMGMAHDFNNLLQAILGHTQLIQHDPSPQRLRRGLATIEQAVRDGVETVGRIRRYARREGESRVEPVDLREVVTQVVEIARPRWTESRHRGGRISVVQELEPVPSVWARPAELREVLLNLVLNAVDAMPQGGLIRLATRTEGDRAVLVVADTGTGIPPELRRRIFEPFFTTKETGTGLGLSIVSGILAGYGATMDVESEPGRGTTFTIRLPAAGAGAGAPEAAGP